MKTYLELEGKPCSKPRSQTQTHSQQTQPQPTQPSTNPMIRKAPGLKASDKRKKTMLTKRKYKVRVLAQLVPTTLTTPVNSTATAPTVASTSTQTPVTRSTAASILVMVYKLATGQFVEVPYPTARPQNKGHPSTQNSNPPLLVDIPSAQVRQGTPLPNTGSASENLFETKKDWLIPPTPVPTCPHHQNRSTALGSSDPPYNGEPKQAVEGCSWGSHCPIHKNEEEHKENWDADDLREQPGMHPQNMQQPQPQSAQCLQPQNNQDSQSFDMHDRYAEQIKLRKEWDKRIERLNEKYNLDYYSSSESDPNSEPDYRYQHKYKTLI